MKPQKSTTSAARKIAVAVMCALKNPALRMSISLKNRPNGGEPVIISIAATSSPLATGARLNVPVPMRLKFDEL